MRVRIPQRRHEQGKWVITEEPDVGCFAWVGAILFWASVISYLVKGCESTDAGSGARPGVTERRPALPASTTMPGRSR